MASSLELNKLLAGVLTAGIIAVGAGVFSGILYRPQPLEQNAFSVVVPEEAAPAAEADAGAAEEPSLAALLASADPSAGEAITRQCAACHVFNEGGENRVGPALWGVVGRDIASVDGFAYSDELQGKEGEWTYENLDAFLAAPRQWAPGTSMSYAGLRNATDRANLIAYLRGQSNDPLPLPDAGAAAEEPAAEEPAPAEEAAAEPAEEAAPATEEAAAEEAAPAEPAVAVAEGEAPAAEEVAAAEAPATEQAAAEAEAPAAAETEVAAATETEAAQTEAAEAPAPAETEAAAAEEPAAEEATAAADAGGGAASPMVAMVADADPAAGERAFRQCAACHTVDQGGQNRVGPNLWNVFGADIGTHEGFNYSDALTGLEGIWTVDKLNAYLENPRGFAPGNRMAFAGLRNEADRAAVIAYLHSLSDDPKPLDLQ
jgi:cytochrome c2